MARQVSDAGGDLDDEGGALILSRSVSAEGRSRAYAGGRSVPVSLLTYLADDLVAVHGQADQQQLLKPGRQREALDRFAGPRLAALLAGYQRAYQRHRDVRQELGELISQARERERQADDLRRGLAGSSGGPRRRRGRRPARRGAAALARRRAARSGDHRARGPARRPVKRAVRGGGRRHPARRRAPGAGGRGPARHRPGGPGGQGLRGGLPGLRCRGRPGLLRPVGGGRPRPGSPPCRSAGRHSGA